MRPTWSGLSSAHRGLATNRLPRPLRLLRKRSLRTVPMDATAATPAARPSAASAWKLLAGRDRSLRGASHRRTVQQATPEAMELPTVGHVSGVMPAQIPKITSELHECWCAILGLNQ